MSARRGPRLGAFLAGAFLLVYFGARQSGAPPAVCEVLMTLPAAFAAMALAARALLGTGHDRRFHGLLAASALGWVGGQLLWARALAERLDPTRIPIPLLDLLFVGFLVPALAAALLGPGPRLLRPDLLDRADAALSVGALAFLFLRLVFVPNVSEWQLRDLRSLLLAFLALAVAASAAARFFLADDAASRRACGLLVAFATTYGIGSAVGNGLGPMRPPGSPLDLVWFVPFFFLAAVPSPHGRVWKRLPAWGLVLLVGPLPLVAGPLARWIWQSDAQAPAPAGSVPFALLAGIGCALRLGLQESRDAQARARDRERREEERRSGRLDSLSAVTGPLLADLRRAAEMLAFRAQNALPALGAEASLVRDQVTRAMSLTREIEAALGGGHLDPHRAVDVGRLLEQTLQGELDLGLPLRVRLTTGALPPILAEPRSLAAAFRELARNAAQASPQGTLEVRGEREPGALVLRFADDGPGIPEQIRASVFDPFFTTGRAGAGPGLGLTLVHFVARDLGGSVRLEPGGGKGASIAMRLPLEGRRPHSRVASPLFLPALLTATMATLISITSGSDLQSGLARGAAGLAALSAVLALLGAARARRALSPFVLLALGALAAGVAPFFADPAWRTLADWPWAAAVLLPLSASLVPGAGRRSAAALLLGSFLVAHAAFVVRPLLAPGSETPMAATFAGGLLRLGTAAAAAVLASRAVTDEARGFLETLSLALGLWAASASAGSWLRDLAPTGAERVADLAIVLPLLVFWRLGRDEAEVGRGRAGSGAVEAEVRDLSPRAAP